MSTTRRNILKGFLVGSSLVLLPLTSYAKWLQSAFKAENYSSALQAIGVKNTELSDQVTLKAPEIAENGAVVPVQITSSIENIDTISLLVEKNPNPLTAQFKMFPGQKADFKIRVRMGESSKIIVVVQADGKSYITESNVKVTIGGCGG